MAIAPNNVAGGGGGLPRGGGVPPATPRTLATLVAPLALAAMGYFKRGLHVISGQVQFDGIDMLNIERNALQRLRGGRLALIPQNSGQSLTPNLRIGQQISGALRSTPRKATRFCQSIAAH